jgi:TolB protein
MLRHGATVLAAVVVWSILAVPAAQATFPGDNGRIAFIRPERILTMEPDGSDKRVIARNANEPAWSADGTEIAFSRFRRSGRTDIFVMDADGQNVRAVTRFRPGFNLSPSWSPNGRRIVFVHNTRLGGTDLYSVRRDGTGLTRLTSTPRLVERAPEWSPDGSRILFSRIRETGPPTDEDLYVMDPDGSNITRVSRSRLHDFQGSWSPDASQIVFIRETRRHGPTVFVMDADGRNATKLTPDDETEEFWPVFSPDGTRIAFSKCADFTCDLYLMDPDGGNLDRLTRSPALDTRPDWQAIVA